MSRKRNAATILAFVAAFGLAPQPGAAQESHQASWFAGIASGWYFPTKKWTSSYTLGGGGSFLVGYAKNDRWAAQLDANMWLCSGNGIDSWDIKVIPEVTHAFGGGAVAPFALTGVGVEYQRLYPAKTAILAAVVPLGAGVQWRMNGGGRFFIEGIYYIASDRLAAHDFPLLAGFRVPF